MTSPNVYHVIPQYYISPSVIDFSIDKPNSAHNISASPSITTFFELGQIIICSDHVVLIVKTKTIPAISQFAPAIFCQFPLALTSDGFIR